MSDCTARATLSSRKLVLPASRPSPATVELVSAVTAITYAWPAVTVTGASIAANAEALSIVSVSGFASPPAVWSTRLTVYLTWGARSTRFGVANCRSSRIELGPVPLTLNSGDCSVTVDLNSESKLRAMFVFAANEPAGLPASPS